MSKTIPIFKFHIKSTATDYFGRIELKKDVVCRIFDFGEFYKYFGYSTDLAKKGILPEEYIWETFFRHSDRNCISCYQLHLIEYLLEHSDNRKQSPIEDAEIEEFLAHTIQEQNISVFLKSSAEQNRSILNKFQALKFVPVSDADYSMIKALY